MGCTNGSTRKTLTFFIDTLDGPHLRTIRMNMRKDDLVIGYIWLVPQSEYCYQIHLSEVIPKERGDTYSFLREALRVGFSTIEKLEQVFALIPVHNKMAIHLTKMCNFKYEGTLPKSYLYENKMENQVIYRLNRGDL